MTDSTQVATAAPATTKMKTVAEGMASRRIFATLDAALAYLTLCSESFSDFDQIKLAAPGVNADGEFDPAIYTDDMAVMVATLRSAKDAKAKIKAIVVNPVPTLDLLESSEAGKAWIQKIIEKELNHVTVRALRDAKDVSTVVDQMPTTVDAFISSARESSGIMETYDLLYKDILATMAKKVQAWQKARLTKVELKKALESKAYALEWYSVLESYGTKGSLFEMVLAMAIGTAKKKGLDPTIFERWTATRNEKTVTVADEDEEEDFDLDDLVSGMLTEEPAAATTEEPTLAEPGAVVLDESVKEPALTEVEQPQA